MGRGERRVLEDGTHVYLWLGRVDVWQKPHHNTVIIIL